MNVELRPGERIDDLQVNDYKLIQHPETFCMNTDSVLLADFAAPKKRDHAVDLGCGNGAVSILMAAHQPTLVIDAVEIQPEMADMAQRNVLLNQLEGRMQIHCMDMRNAWQAIGRQGSSLVVCNPPYGGSGRTLLNRNEAERIARHEDDLTPEDVAKASNMLLKYGGRLCVVYPAQRGFEMMRAMDACRLAPKRVRTVHAFPDKAPKLMLIEAVKGGGSALNWLPPLVLYDAPGIPSAEYRRIYHLELT